MLRQRAQRERAAPCANSDAPRDMPSSPAPCAMFAADIAWSQMPMPLPPFATMIFMRCRVCRHFIFDACATPCCFFDTIFAPLLHDAFFGCYAIMLIAAFALII